MKVRTVGDAPVLPHARWLVGELRRAWLVLAAVAAIGPLAGDPARAEPTIDWVTVGDPGNAADTTGYGAVAESFRIMKYEWTNALYVQYLNAVDPQGTGPNSIYNSNMGNNAKGGITNTGTVDGSRYTVKANMGDKPVNFLSWWDVARVANWMHNGAQTYAFTDATASAPQNTGAYTVGTTTFGAPAPAKNPGALFYIPTEDQWYKAAYYKGSGTSSGYWDYATQSDTAPTAVTADSTGNGSAGSTGNFANFNFAAVWNSQLGNVTTVGTNGGPGAYQTFDMNGNVREWNDLTGVSGTNRGFRGGAWGQNATFLPSTSRAEPRAQDEDNAFSGFRLASPGVPEIDPAGMGSVAALLTGALGLLERRRRRANAA